MRSIAPALLALTIAATPACMGYRLVRPDEVQVPSYEPRPVEVPSECQTRIARAAAGGAGEIGEAEARYLSFCQGQHLIRAQEEEAASRKLEAHAQAASLALQVTTVLVGATVAVLAWVF